MPLAHDTTLEKNGFSIVLPASWAPLTGRLPLEQPGESSDACCEAHQRTGKSWMPLEMAKNQMEQLRVLNCFRLLVSQTNIIFFRICDDVADDAQKTRRATACLSNASNTVRLRSVFEILLYGEYRNSTMLGRLQNLRVHQNCIVRFPMKRIATLRSLEVFPLFSVLCYFCCFSTIYPSLRAY